MTFWQFLTNVFVWFEERATRLLGVASGTIATLAATDVVPKSQLPYYMAAVAVLTYWRGQTTATAYTQAKAIIANVSAAPTAQIDNATTPVPNPAKTS